jgi:hypothetical protein
LEYHGFVTEYRAQILEDANGKRYTAPFPEGISRPVQYGYGINVKVNSVYMSQYQLVQYKRIEEYFQDQVKIPTACMPCAMPTTSENWKEPGNRTNRNGPET